MPRPQHAAPRGENGTYTAGRHKSSEYTGKHREGDAKGSSAQKDKSKPEGK